MRPSVALPPSHESFPRLLSGGGEGEDQQHRQRAHARQQSARRAHGGGVRRAPETTAELPQPERRGGILRTLRFVASGRIIIGVNDGASSLPLLPFDNAKNEIQQLCVSLFPVTFIFFGCHVINEALFVCITLADTKIKVMVDE